MLCALILARLFVVATVGFTVVLLDVDGLVVAVYFLHQVDVIDVLEVDEQVALAALQLGRGERAGQLGHVQVVDGKLERVLAHEEVDEHGATRARLVVVVDAADVASTHVDAEQRRHEHEEAHRAVDEHLREHRRVVHVRLQKGQ